MGTPGTLGTGLASVCLGTLTRSSQVPVVPKPCLTSLCKTFNFAFVLGGDISQLLQAGTQKAVLVVVTRVSPHQQSAAVR